MMKGTVISIEDSMASVMTEDCRIIRTPAGPDTVIGKEITMKNNTQHEVKSASSKKWVAVLVAATVLLFAGIGLLAQYIIGSRTEYAKISVDVNPSVEFTLARDLKVISVNAKNEDAKEYLIPEDYIGLAWREAVDKWLTTLREENRIEVKDVLISGVFPEDAVKLREQLLLFDEDNAAGVTNGLAVRVIYSNDSEVNRQAGENGLSIGRQMLLNQSKAQSREWNEQNIAKAGLGELVQALLGEGQQNQTRITEKNAGVESQNGDPTGEGAIISNKEQNGEPGNGEPTAQEKNREQNTEKTGSAQQSGSTARETNDPPAGSTARDTTRKPGQG